MKNNNFLNNFCIKFCVFLWILLTVIYITRIFTAPSINFFKLFFVSFMGAGSFSLALLGKIPVLKKENKDNEKSYLMI